MREYVVLNMNNAEVQSTSVVNGSDVDLLPYAHGYRELKGFLFDHSSSDTTTDCTIDVKFQESATTASSDFSDISGATFTQVLPADAAGQQEIHFQAAQRYIRSVVTPDGTAATIKAGVCVGVLARALGAST